MKSSVLLLFYFTFNWQTGGILDLETLIIMIYNNWCQSKLSYLIKIISPFQQGDYRISKL